MPTETTFAMTLVPTDTAHLFTPVLTPINPQGGIFPGSFQASSDGFDPVDYYTTGCLHGCLDYPSFGTFRALVVDFSSPPGSVVIDTAAQYENPVLALAFNSQGQLIESCQGAGDATPSTCYALAGNGTAQFTLNAPGISQIVFAGVGGTEIPVYSVTDPPAHLPAPDALPLMIVALAYLLYQRRPTHER